MDIRHVDQLERSAAELTEAHPDVDAQLITTLLRVAYHDLADAGVVADTLPLVAHRRIEEELQAMSRPTQRQPKADRPVTDYEPDTDFIAISFHESAPVERLIGIVDELDAGGHLELVDLVVLRGRESATVTVDDTLDPSPRRAATRVGLSGLILGALAGTPIAGLAIGAAAGALAARAIDLGIPQDIVDDLRDATGPGRIVIAILARVANGAAVLDAIGAVTGGTVVSGNLSAEAMSIVHDAVAGYQWDNGVNPMNPPAPTHVARG